MARRCGAKNPGARRGIGPSPMTQAERYERALHRFNRATPACVGTKADG
jgi:hypothetical protein